MSDLISFYQDDNNDDQNQAIDKVSDSWKIMIVDDDESIHQVTKLALSWVVLDDKPLEFISAYSGAEAKQKFLEYDDIALVLLDVVMETNKAGFEVANYIRHELNNFLTRIVLRTGQPGDVPEREVILNYEIDGYKTKSELTAQALFSMILTSLRSYRDLRSVEDNNRNLEKIVQATSDIYKQSSIIGFINCLLKHLCHIVPFNPDHKPELYYFAADFKNGRLSYISGAPGINYPLNEELFQHLSPFVSSLLIEAHNKHTTICRDGHLVIAGSGKFDQSLIFYFSGIKPINQSLEHLLDILRHNYETAYENLLLNIEKENRSKNLARCLDQRTEELNLIREKLFYAEKLSAIGHLAVGVAQEISKPLGLIKNSLGQFPSRIKPLLELFEVLEKLSNSNREEQLRQLQWLSDEVDFGQLKKTLQGEALADEGALERIYNIVEVLYQFSSIETSNFRKTDIQSLLKTILDDFYLEQQSQLKVENNIESSQLPLATLMPEQISEVLKHLLNNALEAIADKKDGRIKLNIVEDEQALIIEVSDNGIGMDGKTQKRVFDAFYSEKSTRHTGLGLYLAKTILHLHNGSIAVHSESGSGSNFTVSLPLKQQG